MSLEIANLEKSFGGFKVIDNLSMSCPAKKITALIGSNGAGKTTLFNLINGFLQPDNGCIWYYEEDLGGLTAAQTAARGIGRLFQDARLFRHLTALDNVLLAFRRQSGEKWYRAMLPLLRDYRQEQEFREKALDLLDSVGVGYYAFRPVEEMSFGHQKLVAFARLLATDANLLLLDEPCAGLSQKIQKSLRRMIRREADKNKTIVLIEHNLDAIREMADKVCLMRNGRIIDEGEPRAKLVRNRKEAIYS